MKRVFFCLIILLLCSSFVLAEIDDSLFDHTSLELDVYINNDFDLISPTNNYYVDSLFARLAWFPRDDYRQDIHLLTTEPEADVEDDELVFSWFDISKPSFGFEVNADMVTRGDFVKVRDKLSFPLNNLDQKYSPYLEHKEIINVNDDIRILASNIVKGEDDYFMAVFKIAKWVENNIEYNLSSITANAAQKSSWVLENREGVCDELTSLFISLCRSVGIPARFVSGISYSNINQQNDGWGPHGWAEVYFPDVGWVPFDVTYKELGFVDATHIKLRESIDAGTTSVTYTSRSANSQVNPGSLDQIVDVVRRGPKLRPVLNLKIDTLDKNVGFGSYNLIILETTNNKNYYVTNRLSLANVNNMEVIGDNFQAVVLAPGESTKIYWIVKVTDKLKSGFYYTFPISITGSSGEFIEEEFEVAQHARTYSEKYVNSLIEEEDYEKGYPISVDCDPASTKSYVDETVLITCSVTNEGNELLAGVRACLEDDCSVIKILPDETEKIVYKRQFKSLGVKNLVFKAENEKVKENFYVVASVQDIALIKIEDINIPEKVAFDEKSEISFFIRKKSVSNPRNVNVKLEHKFFSNEWTVDPLQNDYEFKTLFQGNNLFFGENEIRFVVTYEDENGKEYTVKKGVVVELEDPNFGESILVLLYSAEGYIEKFAHYLVDKMGNL